MKGYSFPYDPETHVAARGRELDISPKHAREICRALRGMELDRAKAYLARVTRLAQAVPFRRHDGKVGHRRGSGFGAGRYPRKAAGAILKLLEHAGHNAEALGKESDNLRILHIATSRGPVTKGWYPRARGRSSPKLHMSANVEVILEEAE